MTQKGIDLSRPVTEGIDLSRPVTEASLLLTAPALEPVSLDEARTRRALITQSWRLVFDAWPVDGRIPVWPAPLQALTAARELAVERRERELATKTVIAEQGCWYTALPRPLFAVIIYVWKVVVWDKVLGFWTHGMTDPLSGAVAQWATVVLTAYFGGRSLEKVARILRRK